MPCNSKASLDIPFEFGHVKTFPCKAFASSCMHLYYGYRMVIAHVISSDIVMTAWGVQNVTVNIVVRGKRKIYIKKKKIKIPAHHPECLVTSWEGCRQTPNTISISGFQLETAWSSGQAKTNRRDCLSLHGRAAFSPPFPYLIFFFLLEGSPL